MNKILVVVYSYTGTCRRLAELLCDQHGWPMAEITDARPRRGVTGLWRCLFDSWLRREPAVHYIGPPPRNFDTVVLIAPVWAHRLAGPMRSFVASRRESLPGVAVASVMGGSGAPGAIAEIGELIGRAPVLSASFTAHEVLDGSCAARLRAFGNGVRAGKAAKGVSGPVVWSTRAA